MTNRSPRNQFASDNYAGICPEAWQALQQADSGYATSYGDDPWTTKACEALRDFFETDCEVFFVFNGTAANSLALASLCQSYHSVICHERAHVETDECGASEFFSNGTKLLTVGGADGKVDPAEVADTVKKRSDIHYPKPRVLSITQTTELGTLYTPDELVAIHGLTDGSLEVFCHHGGRFHYFFLFQVITEQPQLAPADSFFQQIDVQTNQLWGTDLFFCNGMGCRASDAPLFFLAGDGVGNGLVDFTTGMFGRIMSGIFMYHGKPLLG